MMVCYVRIEVGVCILRRVVKVKVTFTNITTKSTLVHVSGEILTVLFPAFRTRHVSVAVFPTRAVTFLEYSLSKYGPRVRKNNSNSSFKLIYYHLIRLVEFIFSILFKFHLEGCKLQSQTPHPPPPDWSREL